MGRRDSICAAVRAGLLLCAGCHLDTSPLDVGASTLPQPDSVLVDQMPNSSQAGMAVTGGAGSGPGAPDAAMAAPSTDIVLPVSPSADAAGPSSPGDAREERAPEPEGPADAATDPQPVDAAVDAAVAAGPVEALDAGTPVDPPSSLFARCEYHIDCDQGQFCTSYLSLGSAGSLLGYCTTACVAPAEGELGYACPQPESGRVGARCQIATQWCLLEDCENSECPAGLTCVEVQTPIGSSGQTLSTFSCQPSA